MCIPKIKGHFWVERDGEIVDADFPELTRLRKKLKCKPEINVYLRAPKKTEDAMIRLFEKLTLRAFHSDDWNDMMPEFIMVAKMTGNSDGPVYNKCWTNCIQEVYYNGGQIRFGSMGFRRKDGECIWHYAGEHCQHLADFLK